MAKKPRTKAAPQALQVALAHHQAGRLAQAEALYQELLRGNPRHPDTLHLLGLLAHQTGRHELGVELISRAIASNGANPAFHNNLGEAYRALGRFDEAIASYEKALALNPRYPEAYNRLGTVFTAQGRLDEAVASYRQVLALAPDHAIAWYNLGNVLSSQGQFDEASACYHKAVALKPDFAEAYNGLGVGCKARGEVDAAMRYYEQALRLKPDYVEAHGNLANALAQQGKVDQALAGYRQALALKPDYAEAHFNLGNLYNREGRTEEAVACYRQARALGYGPVEIIDHLLASLAGQTTAAAPAAYVRDLFDSYADRFEDHLQTELGYEAPTALHRLLTTLPAGQVRFSHGLDLGCGTGLSGQPFRSMCARLTGIDLSANMVALAEQKQVYDRLVVGDILQFLSVSGERYDLFLATDVFVYVGALEALFVAMASHALPGAYLLFSTESCPEGDFVLQPSARYAHSPAYIEDMAQRHGCNIVLCQAANIRRDKNAWVMGNLYILRFPGG